jgi:hypothetical protein
MCRTLWVVWIVWIVWVVRVEGVEFDIPVCYIYTTPQIVGNHWSATIVYLRFAEEGQGLFKVSCYYLPVLTGPNL